MSTFDTRLQGHVLHVRFGTPGAHNLMRDEWFTDLDAVLRATAADPQVRCLLLSAEGKSFSSGGDLQAFLDGPFAEGGAMETGLARCLQTLETFDKPIVACVHGAAIGGGATLLLHCDFVYAEEGTSFQFPFTRIGIVPELGSTALLSQHAGRRLATELLLLARPFDAATAVRAGLISEALAGEAAAQRAQETAAALAALPPAALRSTKRLLRRAVEPAYARAWRDECQALEVRFAGAEVQEACSAFLAKRAPDFSRFS